MLLEEHIFVCIALSDLDVLNPFEEYRGGKVPMNRYKTEHEEKLEKAIQETPYHVIPRLCLIVVPLDHLIIKKIAAHVDLRIVSKHRFKLNRLTDVFYTPSILSGLWQ